MHVTRALENACEQVVIGFCFAADWLITKPITEHSVAMPKQFWVTFIRLPTGGGNKDKCSNIRHRDYGTA